MGPEDLPLDIGATEKTTWVKHGQATTRPRPQSIASMVSMTSASGGIASGRDLWTAVVDFRMLHMM